MVSILLIVLGLVGYAAYKSAKADDLEHKVEELQKYRAQQERAYEQSAHISIPGLTVSIHRMFKDYDEAARWVGSHVVVADNTITIRNPKGNTQ